VDARQTALRDAFDRAAAEEKPVAAAKAYAAMVEAGARPEDLGTEAAIVTALAARRLGIVAGAANG
jgi:hypothetical protein